MKLSFGVIILIAVILWDVILAVSLIGDYCGVF